MARGYMGCVARIDLTTGDVTVEAPDEQRLRKFVGGSGMGASILYSETGPNTDPLGAENPLIFFAGPLTGTRVLSSNRF